MRHIKNDCQAHDIIIADCGTACANCGVCQTCGKLHGTNEDIISAGEEAKKQLWHNDTRSDRYSYPKHQMAEVDEVVKLSLHL